MHKGIVIVLLAISGCATQKSTYLPDGRRGYTVNCSGSALSWDACYAKAGSICKDAGYDVIRQDGDTGSVASPLFGGSVITRTLLIACK
jgi:hypothetical protein